MIRRTPEPVIRRAVDRGLRERLEGRIVRGALRLPRPVQQRLSGGPTIVDGLELDPEMQLLLALTRLSRQPTFEALGPERARREADRQARAVDLPIPVAERSLTVRGAVGELPARVYVPDVVSGPELLLYLHGGGHVIGGFATHGMVARFVAWRARIPVLMVRYRLAPEHRFPAGVDDAIAAFRWARANAGTFGARADRVIVGGDSAGGNLSAVVAASLRGAEGPLAQWLVYPSTEAYGQAPSRSLFADGFFLTAAQIAWYRAQYLGDADGTDVRASPLLAPDVSGVAPACVVTAGFDPLRDEGEAYAAKLRAASVPTTSRRFDGLIHGFVNLIGVSPAARSALALAVDDLLALVRS